MHIADGVLSTPVLVAGIIFTAAGTAIGLKKLQDNQIPFAAVLSACFFVASLIHFPLGPSSVHLVFSGIIGLLLGWVAFPVILIALILQAVFFSFGGIIVLGVNCLNMALPAVIIGMLFRPLSTKMSPRTLGFLAGFCSILLTGFMVSLSLFLSGDEFTNTAEVVFIGNIPLAFLEGIIASFVIVFIKKVKPEVLNGMHNHV